MSMHGEIFSLKFTNCKTWKILNYVTVSIKNNWGVTSNNFPRLKEFAVNLAQLTLSSTKPGIIYLYDKCFENSVGKEPQSV